MEVSKVMAIVLDWIDADSTLLDPAVFVIFYFKNDVGAFLIVKSFLANLTLIASVTPS